MRPACAVRGVGGGQAGVQEAGGKVGEGLTHGGAVPLMGMGGAFLTLAMTGGATVPPRSL